MSKEEIREAFISTFHRSPDIYVFAPGRANIIGEHTDYNDGHVLPFAIHQGLHFYGRVNDTNEIKVFAANIGEQASFGLDGACDQNYNWTVYISQVLRQLDMKKGACIAFGGDLPLGAGISSSSALACGFVQTLNKVHHLHLDHQELLRLAVVAERGSGVEGGIMDQFTIINGKRHQAILLHCKDQSTNYVYFTPEHIRFYLVNTNVKHNLVETEYNTRRQECRKALQIINQNSPSPYSSLSEVPIQEVKRLQHHLGPTLYHRALFVAQENQRVLQSVEEIKQQNWEALGRMINESHHGLNVMYEVSCSELNWCQQYALEMDDVLGSRMMGGGFGGCTINLTTSLWSEEMISEFKTAYTSAFGLEADIFEVKMGDGILAASDNL